jgi:hypothetical protein
MRWLTEDAILNCAHRGTVKVITTQDFVRIAKRRVLIHDNPEKRSISACPNKNPVIGLIPCLHTLQVTKGYSGFVRIAKHAVCLESVEGLTDGTPPMTIKYTVTLPGQSLVEAAS